jgi:hypothetical protein
VKNRGGEWRRAVQLRGVCCGVRSVVLHGGSPEPACSRFLVLCARSRTRWPGSVQKIAVHVRAAILRCGAPFHLLRRLLGISHAPVHARAVTELFQLSRLRGAACAEGCAPGCSRRGGALRAQRLGRRHIAATTITLRCRLGGLTLQHVTGCWYGGDAGWSINRALWRTGDRSWKRWRRVCRGVRSVVPWRSDRCVERRRGV